MPSDFRAQKAYDKRSNSNQFHAHHGTYRHLSVSREQLHRRVGHRSLVPRIKGEFAPPIDLAEGFAVAGKAVMTWPWNDSKLTELLERGTIEFVGCALNLRSEAIEIRACQRVPLPPGQW